jgi:hypothetical protein
MNQRHPFLQRRARRRLALVTLAALASAAVASTVWADALSGEKTCRNTIGAQLKALTRKGAVRQERCYKVLANLASETSLCVDPSTEFFDLLDLNKFKNKEGAVDAKLQDDPSGKCRPSTASPVPLSPADNTLENYEGDRITDLMIGDIERVLEFTAGHAIGDENLGTAAEDNYVAHGLPTAGALLTEYKACQNAVSSHRRKVIDVALREILACLKPDDAAETVATAFEGKALTNTACLAEATNVDVQTKAGLGEGKIILKCVSPTPDEIGVCSGLVDTNTAADADGNGVTWDDGCVTSSAIAAAKNLARKWYPAEQCATTLGTRTLEVAVDTGGLDLSGVQVAIDYPEAQAGVDGNGDVTTTANVTDITAGTVLFSPGVIDTDDELRVVAVAADFNLAPIETGDLVSLDIEYCTSFKSTCENSTAETCSSDFDCEVTFAHCEQNIDADGTPDEHGGDYDTCTSADTPCASALNPLGEPGQFCKDIDPTGTTALRCVWNCRIDDDCDGKADTTPILAGDFNDCVGSAGGTSDGRCVPRGDICEQTQSQQCGDFSTGSGDDPCPSGESCVTQAEATTCTVTSALDEFGNEVGEDVTCSVSIASETP